jgi:hypothetical protein
LTPDMTVETVEGAYRRCFVNNWTAEDLGYKAMQVRGAIDGDRRGKDGGEEVG